MLCRLCLKTNHCYVKIFDTLGVELQVAKILERHFWFKPHPDDRQSTAICKTCWSTVQGFHEFFVTIEQAHWALAESNVKNEFVAENEVVNDSCHADMIIKEEYPKIPFPMLGEVNENYDMPELGCEIKLINSADVTLPKSKSESEQSTKIARNHKQEGNTKEYRPKPKEKYSVKNAIDDAEMVKKYINMNCELCSNTCENFTAVRKHFRLKHPKIKPFVRCCSRKFFDGLEVVQHAYKHENPEFFKCQQCQKVFSKQRFLSSHMITAHAPEEQLIFHCDHCPKKFARQKQWEYHCSSHVPMEERSFICDLCPNSRFACNDLLKMHIVMYHRREPNVCHVCAKVIRNKTAFDKHVRLHFEDSGPRVKCSVEGCDHWLKDNDNLRQHLRLSHSKDDKSYPCAQCGRVYKNSKRLACHKLNVHSDKTFTCEVCKKSFKRVRCLREHQTQHTGEILYKCKFCTSTFNSNSSMCKHLNKMHPVEWDNLRKTNNAKSKNFLINQECNL